MTNRGARELAEKLDQAGSGSRAKLARHLEVGNDTVSHWLSARQKPVTRYRAQIEELYGVGILAWEEELAEEGDSEEPAA